MEPRCCFVVHLLLRGAGATTFFPVEPLDRAGLQRVRYVLTLDADTRLPRAAATRLVGTMAHPLNRPLLDPQVGRVVDEIGRAHV